MKLTKYRQDGVEMLTLSQSYLDGRGRWFSVLMLVTLHIALWAGLESVWTRPLLFAHLGLFLLWQPLWRGGGQLSSSRSLIIVFICVFAMFWLNWWILAFWVSGLFSLVGGRVFAFQSKWQRSRYLLVMGYLLAVLLFWVTPQLFLLSTAGEARTSLMEVILPLLLLMMVLLPHESERLKKVVAVDIVYSIMLFMLLILLVLGSLAFMTLGQADYFSALLRTLFLIAAVLFVLGLLWNPRLGFSGFGVIFSRYFLNIGTPFELWMKQLADISQREPRPSIFLKTAIGHLAELPWLIGLAWNSDEGSGQLGPSGSHKLELIEQDLRLTLFTRQNLAPSVMMHVQLQSQMLAYFYRAKLGEQRLREMARLQAVHETGARLTHDLKNMLQSLFALISIAEQQSANAQPILQKQLPVMVRRIQATLDKLKIPEQHLDLKHMPLAIWWGNLQQRQQFRNLEWISVDDLSGIEIPFALFDSVADNLIENARNKRMREPKISVQIRLSAHPLSFMVCDSGTAISGYMENQLLHTIVASEDGLGIGLYQSARWAEQAGYCLRLHENVSGRVCFELTNIDN